MQFSVEQSHLLRGLEHTLGVIEKKGALPVLAHCLMEADGQGLAIAATDLELSFRGVFPADVKEPGAFAVRVQSLHALVKSLPPGPLTIDGQEGRIRLEVDGSRYQFLTLPAEQFPVLPTAREEGLVEVEAAALARLISRVNFSMGDDLQYNFLGALWEKVGREDGPALRLVSTDGHRLSLAETNLPGLADLPISPGGVMVPAKAMGEIKRFAEHLPKASTLHFGLGKHGQEGKDKEDNFPYLAFKAGDRELMVRLMQARFPEYRRIIPESFAHRFVFPRQELAATVRRISLLTQERFRGVVLTITGNEVEITHENPEVGRGREMVSLVEAPAPPVDLKIGFNARYLLEPLAVMEGEQMVMEVNDPDKPVRLLDPATPQAQWVVMPMDVS